MQALRNFVRTMATERSLNRVTLMGRVGADARLKGTVEHPVVIFSMATSSGEKTEWHKVFVFRPGLRKVAEDYIKSGTRLYVEGKLSYGHIINPDGGATPTASIIADEIIFVSSTNNNNNKATDSSPASDS